MHTFLTIFLSISLTLYFWINVFVLIVAVTDHHSMEERAEPDIGWFLVPSLFLIPIIQWCFQTKLQFRKNVCRCPECHSVHKTYNQKINKIVGLKGL